MINLLLRKVNSSFSAYLLLIDDIPNGKEGDLWFIKGQGWAKKRTIGEIGLFQAQTSGL